MLGDYFVILCEPNFRVTKQLTKEDSFHKDILAGKQRRINSIGITSYPVTG